MFNFVLQHGITNLLWAFLIDELRWVTPNEDNWTFLVELLLKIFQIGKHVQAVNATVGPKINQNDLAFELRVEGEGFRVEPGVAWREVGGTQRTCIWLFLLRA